MIQRVKKYLLHTICAVMVLVGATACEGFDINFGTGGGDDDNENTEQVEDVDLTICWHLVSFCNAPADVDIFIDFQKSGKFVIYQRTEELSYTVFEGTYTVDEENALLTGVYSDGTPWLSSYNYVVDKAVQQLTMTSVENPSEVAVYEPAKVPTVHSLSVRSASVNDVKPL